MLVKSPVILPKPLVRPLAIETIGPSFPFTTLVNVVTTISVVPTTGLDAPFITLTKRFWAKTGVASRKHQHRHRHYSNKLFHISPPFCYIFAVNVLFMGL